MSKLPKDYLKYWKVIRQYYKVKYKITQSDLDMLLFLHSEKYFTRDRFDEFARILSWDRLRFDRLLKVGWLVIFRSKTGRTKTVYSLSEKGNRLITDIYMKLNGSEISMTPQKNRMFLRKAKYSEKVYVDMIAEMNAFIQQQRHRPRE